MKKMKKKLEKQIGKYIKKFEYKHNILFDFWVSDFTGTVANFGDYFFSFEDIRIDLEYNVPKGIIFNWYDSQLDNYKVNYDTYVKSLGNKSDFMKYFNSRKGIDFEVVVKDFCELNNLEYTKDRIKMFKAILEKK